jgi:hypothetical protein
MLSDATSTRSFLRSILPAGGERTGPERKEASFDLRSSEKSASWISLRYTQRCRL